MVEWLASAALLMSLVGFAYLKFTDPRTRRVARLPAFTGSRRAGLAWGLALLPGPVLLMTGQGAAFVIWLGGAPMLGWYIAALPPVAYRSK